MFMESLILGILGISSILEFVVLILLLRVVENQNKEIKKEIEEIKKSV